MIDCNAMGVSGSQHCSITRNAAAEFMAESPGQGASAASRNHAFRAAMIGPRFRNDPNWPWLSTIAPLSDCTFTRVYIDNTFIPLPKLTGAYRSLQYFRAIRAARRADVSFIFSDDVAHAVTGWLATGSRQPKAIYVGFTQDDAWSARRIERARHFLPRFSAVTVFCEEERQIYLQRFGLDPARTPIIPIHTDEPNYRQYAGSRPLEHDYIVALGSPNRRFEPTARICRDLNIPLVIVTRPKHANDSLAALRSLGATVITDADKSKALTLLKHARATVMPFKDPAVPGGYTTMVHAMFLKTPIIATRCVGVAEHVLDRETGFVTAHDDEAALRQAVNRLWNDRALADEFGERGAERARRLHSLEAAAARFHELACAMLHE